MGTVTARLSSTQAVSRIKRLEFLAKARSQLGTPYVWGGEAPGRGFDCSGLVQWAAAQVGISVPRTSQSQFFGLPSVKDPLPGDLVFFNVPSDGGQQPGHVGICANKGCSLMVNAPHTGANVDIVPTSGVGTIMGYSTITGAGSQGPTGPTGPQGPPGSTGPTGPTGPVGPGKAVAGCSAKGNVFGESGLPIVHFGSASFTFCELKALMGGLLVGVGGFLMLTGVVLVIASATGVTQTAAGVVKQQTVGKANTAIKAIPKRTRPDRDDRDAIRIEREDRAEGARVRRERGREAMRGTPRAGSDAPLRRERPRRTRATADF